MASRKRRTKNLGNPPVRRFDRATLGRTFGQRIRVLRRARALTQEQLAERSDLSVDGIRRIERGAFSPSLDTIARLCNGLDISLPTLFGSIAGQRDRVVEELSDYLATREPCEVHMAWRVLRAIFEPAHD